LISKVYVILIICDNLVIVIYIVILYEHVDRLRCYSLEMLHIIMIFLK
jgi:hypothetical protein